MVHAIFEFIRTHKAHVDAVAKSTTPEQPEEFSSVFEILFPSSPFQEEDPLVSWLNAIASRLEFNPEDHEIPNLLFENVIGLFDGSGLVTKPERNEEKSHSFLFILYLFWIFWRSKNQPLQIYNIFKFFNGFKIEDTRVVLVGQDPVQELPSTGFAFHGTRCLSSRVILRAMQQESLFYKDSQDPSPNPMELSETEFDEACQTYNMGGWIAQNVLLINTGLSYCQSRNTRGMMAAWKIFTDFIVKYLSDTKSSVVFIFAGLEASQKERLVNKEKHLTLNVYHPSRYLSPVTTNPQFTFLDWERIFPFMNANLYLYQKNRENSLIDWNSIGSESPGRNERVKHMTKWFDKLIWRSSRLKPQTGCFVKMGRLLVFKKEEDLIIVRNPTEEGIDKGVSVAETATDALPL